MLLCCCGSLLRLDNVRTDVPFDGLCSLSLLNVCCVDIVVVAASVMLLLRGALHSPWSVRILRLTSLLSVVSVQCCEPTSTVPFPLFVEPLRCCCCALLLVCSQPRSIVRIPNYPARGLGLIDQFWIWFDSLFVCSSHVPSCSTPAMKRPRMRPLVIHWSRRCCCESRSKISPASHEMIDCLIKVNLTSIKQSIISNRSSRL